MYILHLVEIQFKGPIIYFFDGKSFPVKTLTEFLHLAVAFMEHVPEGIAP